MSGPKWRKRSRCALQSLVENDVRLKDKLEIYSDS